MSAKGQGKSPSLDKDDELSTTRIQPGIPKNSLEIEAGISNHPTGDGRNTLTFMGEVLEAFDDDVETVIEKKLPFEKDKGLDIDSELDFELKWDDDTDNTNDDQSKTDAKVDLEPDSDESKSDKEPSKSKTDAKVDLEPDCDESKSDTEPSKSKTDAKVDLEPDYDDESKSDKEPFKRKTDTAVIESLAKEQKSIERETDHKPKIIEKQVDVDEISVGSAKTSEDDAAPDENKLADAFNVDSNIFLDTNTKICLDSEKSLPTSENSSLDEPLVYSDVEVPEIEDEELLDELDAQISESDPNSDEKELQGKTVCTKTLVEPEHSMKESNDAASQQTLGTTMDLDEVKLDSQNEDEKSDPNDTLASTNDLETSLYEINNEHKLKKPDVMLEIPTQELIETFDDSDMSDVALEYDEDVLLNTDVADNDPVSTEDELQIIDDLKNSNEKRETVCDDDKIQTDNGINIQPNILQMDDIDIATKTSEMMDEDGLLECGSENDNHTNIEVKASDNNKVDLMDVDTENEENHADIILEAVHLEPKLIEETDDIGTIADVESTTTLKAELINFSVTSTSQLDTEVIEINSSGDIEPIVSTDTNEVTSVVEMEPETYTKLIGTHPSADLESKLVLEAMDDVYSADAASKGDINAVEVTSTPGKLTEATTVKDVFPTDDVPAKVLKEIKTIHTVIKPEAPSEATVHKEASCAGAKIENVTAVKEVISTTDMQPRVVEEVKTIPTEIEPEVSTEATEVKEATSAEQNLEDVTAVKEVISTTDVPPKVVEEVKTIPTTIEPEVRTEATEVKVATSAEQNLENVTAVKEVISTTDVPPKVVEEVKTVPTEIEPEVSTEVTEVKETTSVEANLENATAVKEVISTTDVPPKVVEEVKTIPTEIEIKVSTEVTEVKEATPVKANLENVTAVKEVISTTDVPPKVIEEVKTVPTEIEPEVSTEATEVKEATSAEANLENVTAVKEVISTTDVPPTVVEEVKSTPAEIEPEVDAEVKEVTADLPTKEVAEKEVTKDTAQPSTSKYMQELSDEDQEVTDSLGLLAESSRVMDDDDEQEHEDEDDDDDFDPDDESNQMIADHSEDSNAQHSETDVKEAMEVEEASADKEPLQFQIAEVLSATDIEVLAESDVTESVEGNEDTEVETAVKSLLEIEEGKSNEESESTVTEEVECATDDAVKLSEEPVKDDEAEGAASKLRELLSKGKKGTEKVEAEKTSPSKTKKLEIAKQKNEINIVELEESSSEDDIQEVSKPAPEEKSDVTTVNIPDEVEVMSASAGSTSEMRHGEGEVVISGVPKPPPQKLARLNTSEVTIKTTAASTESLVIPEAKMSTPAVQDSKPKLGLEIFSLDSDDDDEKEAAPKQLTAVEIDKRACASRCINMHCTGASADTYPAGAACVAYYGGRRGAVCRRCDMSVTSRGLSLIEGIKDYTPLLSLHMGQVREELVEISDSDSEEEISAAKTTEDAIGEKEAAFAEAELAAMFNKTWKKYSMDQRLKGAETEINLEVMKLEEECSKISKMLNECQVVTDKLRNDLYDTFSGETNELPAILIYDTPSNTWSGLEEAITYENNKETRQNKRRSSIPEPPAKRPAIPLGYAPLDSDANTTQNEPKAAVATDVAMQNDDDNSDISVVKLSAESAPADLPQPGTPTRPPLRPHMTVYAMRNAFGSWSRARIMDVQSAVNNQFTMCRVKFEHKVKNPTKMLQARCLAYEHPSDVRMTIGTRLIALFKDNDNKRESYYSGIVAEIPNPVNNYRYLVFFDDGYAQYVQHSATRLVCECAPLVWDEVHPFSRQFVREYLCSYPERPMVRVHAGQSIRTEYNGKWWDSKVLQVDASLVQVHFDKENRTEWIYRGSTRLAPLYWELQAAERQRARPLPRAQPGRRFNMPYVEYTRSDETAAPAPGPSPAQIEQEIRRQRAVAKKSTAAPPPPPAPASLDGIASRVVFYTPKNAIKPHKMVPHTCGPRCRRTDVLALKDLRTYNPLTKPLLSGWERQIVKFKWSRSVMYRAPCGRRLRNYQELHRYLQVTGSDMPVDLFDFGPNTHCLAEFVLTKCRISKKDLSHGKENVPVPCVNYYDDSLPEFCSYNTERTPTAGVPLNLDPEFLCGCDCTDDCADKSKCACWKMTLEGARTIGLDTDEVGYVYKRLPDPLPSGIYECNSRCKCRQTCLNRVAQHPLQLKLQVFKTLNRGWGIRALNDIPKGAFLCVYAGNLLTDATANLDGLNEGDEYLAELDYIEVVEQMKEGFEEDIPDADKKLDKKESGDQDDDSSTTSSSEEEEDPRENADDDDFRPTLPLAHAPTEFSKRLRKREKKKKEDAKEEKQKEREPNSEDNCITISDDEELREPARFAAQAGMGDKGFVSKHKSVRAHFGKDEACYIMDAKVQGNIGRYLNHSCTPNVFVQNVFVDTHDPRFPWVAFFALSHIRAGTELTWNYNYDVGSVPGKVLYCHCSAPNCRGRLL